jgi:hypothetical protein
MIILFIPLIFLLDYLALKLGIIPRALTILPEMFSAIIVTIIVLRIGIDKGIAIGGKYIFLLIILLFHYLSGLFIESVSSGVAIAGARNYLKYLPFFFLPAICGFDENQMRKQMYVILLFAILQCPLTIYQRFVQFSHKMHTGDPVTGMLSTSGLVTVLSSCVIAVLMGFFLKNRLKLSRLIFLVIFLFVPITLNETKVSFIFLPLSILLPIILLPQSEDKFKRLAVIGFIGFIFMSIFVGVYNEFRQARAEGFNDIVEFYTQKQQLMDYLYKTQKPGSVVLGKVDSIVLPVQYLSEDKWHLVYGLGIGNASDSFMKGFSGEYAEDSEKLGFGMTAVGDYIWEIGLLGLFIHCLFLYFIFRDSIYVSVSNKLEGAIASGWATVTVIIFLSLFYKSIFQDNTIGYLFWYISGYIATSRYRLSTQVATQNSYFQHQYSMINNRV